MYILHKLTAFTSAILYICYKWLYIMENITVIIPFSIR